MKRIVVSLSGSQEITPAMRMVDVRLGNLDFKPRMMAIENFHNIDYRGVYLDGFTSGCVCGSDGSFTSFLGAPLGNRTVNAKTRAFPITDGSLLDNSILRFTAYPFLLGKEIYFTLVIW